MRNKKNISELFTTLDQKIAFMEMNAFTVNLINNTFSENSADGGNSGAICVSDNFILNSKNNICKNNKAVEGGVIINVGSATDKGGVFLNYGNLSIITVPLKTIL